MTTAFQPNPAPQSLLAIASAIISASKLPFEEDHDAAVVIVARALGKLDADYVANFDARSASPAIAAKIVYAALELEASDGNDGATVEASASTSTTMLPPTTSAKPTEPDPDATAMLEKLTLIKEVIPPLAAYMTAQEIKIIEISARLSRLEAGTRI